MDADVFKPDAALLPLLPPEPDPFADHVFFSAEESLKGWAVYHDPKPQITDRGTSYGLRVPVWQISEMITDPQAIAARTAEILNQHWYEKEVDA